MKRMFFDSLVRQHILAKEEDRVALFTADVLRTDSVLRDVVLIIFGGVIGVIFTWLFTH
jgi:hypothetical protein